MRNVPAFVLVALVFPAPKRRTLLGGEFCFFCPATALSPPVGRWLALIGRPPRVSAMVYASPFGCPGMGPAGAAAGGLVIIWASAGWAGAGDAGAFAARRAVRLSRAFLRFSR